jgi:NOL1/NOP2/fmu family ribosome biogenesis protein
LPSLKEDGILIYSTCTFAQEENERILGALVDTGDYESIRFHVPEDWPVDVLDSAEVFACRFLPHRSAGEGFFIGALRKKSSTTPARIKSKAVFKAADTAALTCLKPWCKSLLHPFLAPDGYLYDSTLDLNQLNTLATQVYVLQPGIQLGKTMRNDFIPDHGLAMSRSVAESVQRIEVNEQQALQYLRGESLQLTVEGISGWCLATYQGHPLGWMKLIGTRVNNYYPKEWRVRMR